jgi:heme/copper-type cytochrome/quinol oxidase subunit 2
MKRRLVGLALLAAGAAAPSAPAPRPAAEGPPRGGDAIEVRVSKAGFQPSRLTLRRGETARLVLSSTDAEHCFAVDAFRVEKRVRPGRPTRLEFVPDRAGAFPFYCCLESGEAARAERGELAVTE